MIRIFLAIMISANIVFAIDATMEIIKKKVNLPMVSISLSNKSVDDHIAQKIREIVIQDLAVSGHFNTSEKKILADFDSDIDRKFLLKHNIDLSILLEIEQTPFGGVVLFTKVVDINSNTVVMNKSFTTSKQERYPFLGHRVAIAINDYMDAPKIDWMDKFVIFSRYKDAKQSEIVIADYTLTYQKVIISGGLNIFPKWGNKSQEIFYYTTYNAPKPTLMKVNLYSGKEEKVLSSDGMIACSDVSSDGKKLLVTMSPNSQPDIYVYNTQTKIKKRLTTYKGIDVGASFVENNQKIVFVSDRLQYPNIFAKEIGKRGIERLVYHGRNNSSCSTYKNYVVYTSREGDNEFSKNSFNLYLISTQSDFIRRLTTTGRNQFPKFSKDGESILFTKTFENKSSLGIIRLNYNKSFLFPLKVGKLQSIDW